MPHLKLIVLSLLGHKPILTKNSAWGCKHSYTSVGAVSVHTPKVDGTVADCVVLYCCLFLRKDNGPH